MKDPSLLVEMLPDAVVEVDATQRIIATNRAMLRLTGNRKAELQGKVCGEVLDACDHDGRPVGRSTWHSSTRLRNVRAMPEQVVTITAADGRTLSLRITGVYRRDRDGHVVGAVFCLAERTGRRGVAVSGIEIISTVSHELRSPVTSVKGFTSLLLSRWDRLGDDEKLLMLGQINHDADRVTRLITELLDIGRIETGRLVLHRDLVDLPALVLSVVDKVRLEYGDLDAELNFPVGFPRVFVDPDKIEQVVTNLIENACKYASVVGLCVSGVVLVPDEGDGATAVEISVTDRGRGIPQGDLGRVFNKFFRQSGARPTGSGLGLWISRGLIEAHGGRLDVTSSPGEGSTFRFSLPHDVARAEASGVKGSRA